MAIGDAFRDPGSGVERFADETWVVPSEGTAFELPNENKPVPALGALPKINVDVVLPGAGGGSVLVGALAPKKVSSLFVEAEFVSFATTVGRTLSADVNLGREAAEVLVEVELPNTNDA